jgi:hypothetical protein
MALLVTLVNGCAGKPSHAAVGGREPRRYTVGVAMLIAGAAGLAQEAMSTTEPRRTTLP